MSQELRQLATIQHRPVVISHDSGRGEKPSLPKPHLSADRTHVVMHPCPSCPSTLHPRPSAVRAPTCVDCGSALCCSHAGSSVFSLILPAAMLGAVGYGYCWWKVRGLLRFSIGGCSRSKVAVGSATMSRHLLNKSISSCMRAADPLLLFMSLWSCNRTQGTLSYLQRQDFQTRSPDRRATVVE